LFGTERVRAIRDLKGKVTAVARSLVDKSFAPRYDSALQTLKDIPYDRWRLYDPEDAVRFYALRLHEARMIKLPGSRFLKELRKELKG
jgi:NitT/TauT family transport system substrate-binding protein